jgi:hypothetical protein
MGLLMMNILILVGILLWKPLRSHLQLLLVAQQRLPFEEEPSETA